MFLYFVDPTAVCLSKALFPYHHASSTVLSPNVSPKGYLQEWSLEELHGYYQAWNSDLNPVGNSETIMTATPECIM